MHGATCGVRHWVAATRVATHYPCSREAAVRIYAETCQERGGLAIANTDGMAGWRSFKEIDAWQLSMKLQSEFIPFLERPPASRNRKFCEDAIDAVSSPARNIAEGFEKYGHAEFAKFVLIAKGSLGETQTNLITAKNRRFLPPDDFERLWKLSEAAKSATTGLWRSLKRSEAPDPHGTATRKRKPHRTKAPITKAPSTKASKSTYHVVRDR